MTMTDLHTHTSYCDGKNSPAEMADEAFKRGFKTLAFSGHSYVPFDLDCCMTPDGTERYKAEVNTLKTQYKGKMDIFLGLEQDYYSAPAGGGYDYLIGSVHYILKNGVYYAIDLSPDATDILINKHFNGDYDTFAEEYFSLVADVVKKTQCDIIGHFDLISKFCETHPKPLTERYKKAALDAVRALIPTGCPFEINVGAITRGYRTAPYPADFILSEINRLGGRIVINGDCHNKENLGDYLELAAEFAKQCGFKERFILTPHGFEAERL